MLEKWQEGGTVVVCCACGKQWDAASPRVLYRSEDRRWWCRDELACRRREAARDAGIAAIRQALDAAWAALEAAGWDIPGALAAMEAKQP